MSKLSQREIDLTHLVSKFQALGKEELNEDKLSSFRKEYIDVLAKHKLLYHFDESAVDIHWDTDPKPNKTEIQHLDYLTDCLYSDELFELSIRQNTNLRRISMNIDKSIKEAKELLNITEKTKMDWLTAYSVYMASEAIEKIEDSENDKKADKKL